LLSVVAQAFALVIFIYLCAGEDLPPFGDLMRAVSGRFRSMRTSFPTRTHIYRSFKETHSPGEECVSVVRDERFHKNSDYL
jgi:hypothetical protein